MIKKILSLAVSLILLLVSGCGSAGTPEQTAEETIPAGNYILAELYDENGASLTDRITELEQLGRTITLQLNEDGTGTYTLFGDAQTVAWTNNDITIEGQTMPLEWNGQTITILSSGESQGRMVFVPTAE